MAVEDVKNLIRMKAAQEGLSFNEDLFAKVLQYEQEHFGRGFTGSSIYNNPARFAGEFEAFGRQFLSQPAPAPAPAPTPVRPAAPQSAPAPPQSDLVSLVKKRLGVNSTLSGPLNPSLSGVAASYTGGISTRRRTLSNLSSKEDDSILTKIK